MKAVHPATLAVLLAAATSAGVEVDTTFQSPISSGAVHALGITPGGSILAAGEFLSVNGSQTSIIRLKPDGSPDPDFSAPLLDGGVYTLALTAEGAIYAGGSFNSADGAPHPNIARLLGNGPVDNAFTGGPEGRVVSLALLADNAPVFGGSFRNAWGHPATYLASLNASGGWNSSFAPVLSPGLAIEAGVSALVVQSDGKVLAGGIFELDGQYRTLARFNRDGTPDTSFSGNPGPILYLKSILPLEGGRILVTGVADPDGHGFVRRLNADGSIDTAFVPPVIKGSVECAVNDDAGGIIAGGSFTVGRSTGLVRLRSDGSLDTNWVVDIDGPVKAIAWQGHGKVLVAGSFSKINGIVRPGIARLIPEPAFSFRSLEANAAGQFVATLRAEPGRTYILESSTDLSGWTLFSTNTATNSGLEVTDRNSAKNPHRFFRARLVE